MAETEYSIQVEHVEKRVLRNGCCSASETAMKFVQFYGIFRFR